MFVAMSSVRSHCTRRITADPRGLVVALRQSKCLQPSCISCLPLWATLCLPAAARSIFSLSYAFWIFYLCRKTDSEAARAFYEEVR